MVMKEMLTEQIGGLENILAEAKYNLVQKINTAFRETFELEGIEHSNLDVYRERADFKFNNQWAGEVNLYYYETYDESIPKLEMSIPSFRDTDFSRVMAYGKIAEQAKLHGEEFISKLQALKAEYKNGITTVQNKLSEATRALVAIEKEEERLDKETIFTALNTVGRVFEKPRWVQVNAKDSVWSDSVRVEKTPGKKTYTIHYTYNTVAMKCYNVREQYIMDLVNKINTGKIK
jgi:hypothetical protein